MFRSMSRTFLTGLVTLLPVVLTLYLLFWFAVSAESLLGQLIRLLIPDQFYRPGMGVVMGLLMVFAVGLLMHAYVVQWLFAKAEGIVYHVPLIKTIYGSIREFLDYFSPARKREFEQVVAVRLGDTGMELIGFITQAAPEQMPADFRGTDSVLVYLPLSYMIGGYTLLMPRSTVRPLQMSMEEAMRFTLTAGVTGNAPAGRAPHSPVPRR